MIWFIQRFWLSWTVLRFFTRPLIHFTPCSCGSIISGQRLHCVTMAPFSKRLMRSAASPSFFHLAKSLSVASTVSGSTPSVSGIWPAG